MDILYAGAGKLATGCAAQMKSTARSQWAVRRTPRTGVSPFDMSFTADLAQAQTWKLPASPTHVLYTATPSGRTPQAYRAVYQEALQRLIDRLDLSALQRFVFVSSTAVYAPGTEWVNEDSPTEPPAFNGQALLAAEQFLHQALGDKLVILRLAGLYGPQRVQLFERLRAGRAVVPSGEGHWVNRLHDDDAVHLCAWALRLGVPAGIYLGVDNTPMEIAQLYDTLATWLKAPPVARGLHEPPTGKRLSNQGITGLGFRLQWPSTFEGYRHLLSKP
ncbi:NAD-dependent epimerase/dehydratase family protein [Pusillimonas sp. CC-YST705]|uniref:NAD-dependent epimerase/dehydratase family protein n=1 Tax=Mesopusillimonas faecipullorum TaxID=2755040 RepID=A0ABS8CE53_9BURK|nr:NAD-dependent epimerase/dehydratase family protein [Mesopusillimonas faecipullorum]MCB5363864.1 NAD-dependent epimerase/dehydratase family protein [Mesopusillimonas faecipullorum]